MNHSIQNIVQQIVKKFTPDKIILFGSYAYGNPEKESDVDLLIIMDFSGSSLKQAAKIRQSIDYHVPLDLLVRSPLELSRRIAAGDFFLWEITQKGKIVYDRQPVYRVD